MIQQLQTLTDQVTANNSLVASAVQLIGGLAAQIEASKTDPVALQALADSLKQNDDALTAAVLANTPASHHASGRRSGSRSGSRRSRARILTRGD